MESANPRKRILFLAANPKNTVPLRLDEEIREIDAGLRRANNRHNFDLLQKWAVRPRDMRQAMLDVKPNIVHFSGHGSTCGGLVLEDATGQPKLIEPMALAGLFSLFSHDLECVLLNACYSESQAEAINDHIKYVIGMNDAIGDKASIEFAVGFYDALGGGQSVETAYKFGCNAIQLEGLSDNLIPVLKSAPSLSASRNLESGATKKWVLVLSATIDEVDKDKAEAIIEHLRHLSQDASLTIRAIKEGSVKLVIQSSAEAFDKINTLIRERKVTEIAGLRIQEIGEDDDPYIVDSQADCRRQALHDQDLTSERFLKEYKNYIETVLVPTRQELKKLFGQWEESAYWDTGEGVTRRPTPTPVQKVYSRIKRPESVVDKIHRHSGYYFEGLTPNSFKRMNDTLGIRVVLYFLQHLPSIDRQIREHSDLEICEQYPPKAYLNKDLAERLSLNHLSPVQQESGYASLHYILRLRQSAVPVEERPWFELQVRTLTEDVRGEIEHVLGYKPDKRTSFALRKQFQIISKSLEAIDEHFNFLFEELLRSQEQVNYNDVDPLNAENLPAVLSDLGLGCAQREIDGLLKLLVSRGVSSVRDLRRLATARTREIVWSTYYAQKGKPPNNFEAVASLAAVLGCDDDADMVQRVRDQIEFLKAWERIRKEGPL